jgi:hypothetical protein
MRFKLILLTQKRKFKRKRKSSSSKQRLSEKYLQKRFHIYIYDKIVKTVLVKSSLQNKLPIVFVVFENFPLVHDS